MAKKKTAETANIKAAPILRAESEDPTPETPETPVITKSYSVRDDWKDKGVVNYVAFKSVDGEVQDLTVNGEPAGGGGSGKEIKVTVAGNDASGECYVITNLFNTPSDIVALSINEEHNYGLGTQGHIETFVSDGYADVLLLKDGVVIDILPATGYTYTVTGSATPTTQNAYKVTGNCAVTFIAE